MSIRDAVQVSPSKGAVAAILLSVLLPATTFGDLAWGSHPVSERLASAWVGHGADEPRPLALAFFTGEPGWLDGDWKQDFGGGVSKAKPAFNQLTGSGRTLRIEVSADASTVIVQDQSFTIADSNVFLVIDADRPAQRIVPLGTYDLTEEEELPLAIAVMHRHPDLSARLSPWLTTAIDYFRGWWGWSAEGGTCAENPHRLGFLSDGSLELTYAHGVGSEPPVSVQYEILGGGGRHFRLRKEGETETDAEGNTVLWDLILLDEDSYCWRRSDWQDGGCTQPIRRCGEEILNPEDRDVLADRSGLAVSIDAADNPAPEGCHWQSIPELKAHLAVPDGWEFERSMNGETLVYDVRPGETTFGSPLRTQFRMVVRKNVDSETVVDQARAFVASMQKRGVPLAPMEEQAQSAMVAFASVVELRDEQSGVHESTVAVSALANTQTGTLYTIRIDIPAGEIDVMAPLANKLFRTIRVDDEI